MKKNLSIVTFLILSIFVSCVYETEFANVDEILIDRIVSSSKTGMLDYFLMPETGQLNSIPNQDPQNPITQEKIDLGKQLFFETALAQSPKEIDSYETFSCATCHVPQSGFLPGRIQGIADGAHGFGQNGNSRILLDNYLESEIDTQGIRPLTVMNVAYMTNTLWSGAFGANDKNVGTEEYWDGIAEINHTGLFGIEAQNIEGLHLHRMEINDRVLYEFGYSELFDKAFPNLPLDERYSVETASFALAAYLRSLLTNEAPFQKYLRGNLNSLTAEEKNGALLFFGKANCISCHNGPSFSSVNFYRLGTKDLFDAGGLNTSASEPRSLGRAFFTNREADKYAFKVPQLYNLKDYATFFHGSSKNSLEEVLDFKMNALSENNNVADEQVALKSFSLTAEEKKDLLSFLQNALYDEEMNRYVPNEILSGNCFPNNDPQSRIDIGCN